MLDIGRTQTQPRSGCGRAASCRTREEWAGVVGIGVDPGRQSPSRGALHGGEEPGRRRIAGSGDGSISGKSIGGEAPGLRPSCAPVGGPGRAIFNLRRSKSESHRRPSRHALRAAEGIDTTLFPKIRKRVRWAVDRDPATQGRHLRPARGARFRYRYEIKHRFHSCPRTLNPDFHPALNGGGRSDGCSRKRQPLRRLSTTRTRGKQCVAKRQIS